MKTLRKLNNLKINKRILEELKEEQETLKNKIIENLGIKEKDLNILLSWVNESTIKNITPNNIPIGDYANNSQTNYSGEKVEGELLVLRNSAIIVVKFYNNGTLESPKHSRWNDNLKEGDIILGHKWIKNHYDNGTITDKKSSKIFYKKSYIYHKEIENEINNLEIIRNLLKEWSF